MAEQDDSQKTEEPTAKRLSEALKKGQVASSQEFKTWFLFLFATAVVAGGAPWFAGQVMTLLGGLMGRLHDITAEETGFLNPLSGLVVDMMVLLSIPLFIFMIAGVVGSIVQHPFVFTLEKVKPDLKKVSPLSGLKKKFSMQVLVDAAKTTAKLVFLSALVFLLTWPDRDRLDTMMYVDLLSVAGEMHVIAVKLMMGVLIFMTIIAALDYAYVKYKHHKSLKMTKQEVKDERKQTDGDPLVKGKIRSLRMERARQRMMAAVPQADVVVTNPTHYAVALEYKHGQHEVPILLAKGVDEVAMRIREVADEYDIPIVENPPLARALYATVELEEEVPPEHYKAVAEVIGFIMKLRRSGQVKRQTLNL